MNEIYLNSFVEAIYTILPSFEINDLKITSLEVKDNMFTSMEVTAVVGLVGSVEGNVSYSFSMEAAKKFASSMMMGEPVEELDKDARSALAELSNLITGRGCKILSNRDTFIDFTTPTFIIGKDINYLISTVKTLAINVETEAGEMQVNVGIEI